MLDKNLAGFFDDSMARIFKILLLIGMALSLAGCGKFDKTHFIKSAFGTDLTPVLSAHPSKYIDGRLDVYEVDLQSPLYRQFFSNPENFFTSSHASIEGPGQKIKATQKNPVQYRAAAEGFDASQPIKPTIVYIPSEKRLIFLYVSRLFDVQ